MGVEKNVLKPDLGINQPKKGQKVSVHYTGLFSVDIFI